LLFQGWTVTDPAVLAESGTHSPLREFRDALATEKTDRARIADELTAKDASRNKPRSLPGEP